MAAVAVLLVTVTVTLFVTRIATVALAATGLSRESARFQARSALSGVGFTTGESEKVTLHPVRRRIIMILMLFGNVGIITLTATLLGSFISSENNAELITNLLLLLLGLAILWLISISSWIDRRLSRLIQWALQRWTHLDVNDYVSLLHVAAGYTVTEMVVDPGDWLVGKDLAEANLAREGILVLGVQRPDKTYVGAPTAKTRIDANDVLIVYGASAQVQELAQRTQGPEGYAAHQKAVAEQQQRAALEDSAGTTDSQS